ncbi:unnamed protein product, partial [Symbiodinium natans]
KSPTLKPKTSASAITTMCLKMMRQTSLSWPLVVLRLTSSPMVLAVATRSARLKGKWGTTMTTSRSNSG